MSLDQGVRVKVQDTASQVIYTDAVVVNGSPLGFVLNFGQWAPEEPGLLRVYTRVGMSPNHLKLLAGLLAHNVAGYEQQFGEITTSPQPAAPHHHIGFEPQAAGDAVLPASPPAPPPA